MTNPCVIRHRSMRCGIRQHLREAPLLRGLQDRLLGQEHLCSDKSLAGLAFALNFFAERRAFRPSGELLTALDATLLSRLGGVPGQHPSCASFQFVAPVLQLFGTCNWRPSTALQESLAAWLLGTGGPGAGEHRPGHGSAGGPAQPRKAELVLRGSAGEAVPPRKAELVLRAWVFFATSRGSPAHRTLPAVRHALGGPLAAHPTQLGGATGVLQRALTDRLTAATSVAAVTNIWECLGVRFGRTQASAALCKLAILCAPASPCAFQKRSAGHAPRAAAESCSTTLAVKHTGG